MCLLDTAPLIDHGMAIPLLAISDIILPNALWLNFLFLLICMYNSSRLVQWPVGDKQPHYGNCLTFTV